MWGVREEGLGEGDWYWGLKMFGRQIMEDARERLAVEPIFSNPSSICPKASRQKGKSLGTFPLRFDKTAFFSFAIYSFLLSCCTKTLTFFTEEYPGLVVSEGWVCWSPVLFMSVWASPSHLSLLGASYLRNLKGQRQRCATVSRLIHYLANVKNNLKTSLSQGTGYSCVQSDLAEALACGWLMSHFLILWWFTSSYRSLINLVRNRALRPYRRSPPIMFA